MKLWKTEPICCFSSLKKTALNLCLDRFCGTMLWKSNREDVTAFLVPILWIDHCILGEGFCVLNDKKCNLHKLIVSLKKKLLHALWSPLPRILQNQKNGHIQIIGHIQLLRAERHLCHPFLHNSLPKTVLQL